MTLPLVTQLRFARSEFVRCLNGVTPQEGASRPGPINALSWTVGHLTLQEHFYWVYSAQGQNLVPGLFKRLRSELTPPWEEMWGCWRTVTAAADRYLDSLTSADLDMHLLWEGKPAPESVGTLLLRNTFHYWFHLGEAHAARQNLGHTGLPDFVGQLGSVRYQ